MINSQQLLKTYKYPKKAKIQLSVIVIFSVTLTLTWFVVSNSQPVEADHHPGTENCGDQYMDVRVYAMDNTETAIASEEDGSIEEPFGNPDLGSDQNREQIPVSITPNGSNLSSCSTGAVDPYVDDGGTTVEKIDPSSSGPFTTTACEAGNPTGDCGMGSDHENILPLIYAERWDLNSINLSAPQEVSTPFDDDRELFHVATTYEDGDSEKNASNWSNRDVREFGNFPNTSHYDDMAIQPEPSGAHPERRWIRLIFHYADCRDDIVRSVFPNRCPEDPGNGDNGDDDEPPVGSGELETDITSGNMISYPGGNVSVTAYIENTAQMSMSDPVEPTEPTEPTPPPIDCSEEPPPAACTEYENDLAVYENEYEQWQDDHAQWQQDQADYDQELADKTVSNTQLDIVAYNDDSIIGGMISPDRRSWNTGTLQPQPYSAGDSGSYNYRQTRTGSFGIDSSAIDEGTANFRSEAYEDGTRVDLSSNRPTAWSVRNFDLQPTVITPTQEQDELTGPFRVRSRIDNNPPSTYGMGTGESDFISIRRANQNYVITVTKEVISGRDYVGDFTNIHQATATSYDNSDYQEVGWTFDGSQSSSAQFHYGSSKEIWADIEVLDAQVLEEDEVCFRTTIQPRYRDYLPDSSAAGVGSIATGSSSSHIDCVDVQPVEGPYLQVDDGDVHAGSVVVDYETTGELCSLDGNDDHDVFGRIRPSMSTELGSRGTYAVSAVGRIANFSSANSVGNNLLTFGNIPTTGQYRTICRTDLTDSEYYEELGHEVGGGPGNMNALFAQLNNPGGGGGQPGDGDVIEMNGDQTLGDVELSGGTSVTVIVRGNLTIDGNIEMESAQRNTRSDIPSLALIVEGNVGIESDVDTIEAYISSNGSVNTCSDAPFTNIDGGALECANDLTIRGALLAQELRFRRTGASDGSPYSNVGETGPSETIAFAPELLLSPPPGILGSSNNIFAERPFRERLPFF